MLIKTISAFVRGIEAIPIFIETDVSQGLPFYQIVGQPDNSIRESKERIRLGIQNSGYTYPKGKITVNMAPAEIRKSGSHFDLAIAMGMLAASGQLEDKCFDRCCFLGELSLDGKINPIHGVLPMMSAMKNAGIHMAFVPKENVQEATLLSGMQIYGVTELREVVHHFLGEPLEVEPSVDFSLLRREMTYTGTKDFADVRGQESAKRAITVSVAGGHGLLMIGSPSTGKSMLAERIPTIMPEMRDEEILETTMVYSVAGQLTKDRPIVATRPFRHPHHKLTTAGLLGGGVPPKPGEITLANKGVLFLDEIGEFDYRLIDGLRVPLETKSITLVRNQVQYTYPADFLLVGASNPCPCGYLGDPVHACKCTAGEIQRYQRRFSGPIMDRVDMHMHLMPIAYEKLNGRESTSSADMRDQILRAREIQRYRYEKEKFHLNSQLDAHHLNQYAPLAPEDEKLLAMAYERMKLNPRTVMKVRKLARTIADLEGSEDIQTSHLTEALQFRERYDER